MKMISLEKTEDYGNTSCISINADQIVYMTERIEEYRASPETYIKARIYGDKNKTFDYVKFKDEVILTRTVTHIALTNGFTYDVAHSVISIVEKINE